MQVCGEDIHYRPIFLKIMYVYMSTSSICVHLLCAFMSFIVGAYWGLLRVVAVCIYMRLLCVFICLLCVLFHLLCVYCVCVYIYACLLCAIMYLLCMLCLSYVFKVNCAHLYVLIVHLCYIVHSMHLCTWLRCHASRCWNKAAHLQTKMIN